MNAAEMVHLAQRVVGHCETIAQYFTGRVKVSILVRNLDHPDGQRDVFVSADATAEVITAIQRADQTGQRVADIRVVRGSSPDLRLH